MQTAEALIGLTMQQNIQFINEALTISTALQRALLLARRCGRPLSGVIDFVNIGFCSWNINTNCNLLTF